MTKRKSPRLKLLTVLLTLVAGPFAHPQNVRLVFPQVAVGDIISTRLDLTNAGLRSFDGTLSILNDSGEFLPVSINDEIVNEPFDLVLAPREVVRLQIASSGEPRAGHALIQDRKTYKSVDLGGQIDGTAVFELRDGGGEVIDSVGVPGSSTVFLGSGVRQHFFFLGEAGAANTGLALSNAFPISTRVGLTARATDGTVVDNTQISLSRFGHRAFFIHEVLTLPAAFLGTVEAEAEGPLFALALRQSETAQLSAVQVSAYPLFFDFTVEALGRETISGEMTLNFADGLIRGLARITSTNPDGDFDISPVSGSFIPGFGVIGSFYTSLEGQVTGITFLGFFTDSLSADHQFMVSWAQLDVSTPGTLTLTRRDASVGDPTDNRIRFLAEYGPWTVVGFDNITTGTASPLVEAGVTVAAPNAAVRDASNSVAPHEDFFGDVGSPPKFFGSLVEFTATFTADVTAVGVDLAPFSRDLRSHDSLVAWTLTSEAGALLDSGTMVYDFKSPGARFFGLVSKVPFRSLTLRRMGGGTLLIDDLRYQREEP